MVSIVFRLCLCFEGTSSLAGACFRLHRLPYPNNARPIIGAYTAFFFFFFFSEFIVCWGQSPMSDMYLRCSIYIMMGHYALESASSTFAASRGGSRHPLNGGN